MNKEESRISTRISKRCSDDIDALVKNGHAMNRSEFVRDAIKGHIKECSSSVSEKEVEK